MIEMISRYRETHFFRCLNKMTFHHKNTGIGSIALPVGASHDPEKKHGFLDTKRERICSALECDFFCHGRHRYICNYILAFLLTNASLHKERAFLTKRTK